MYESWHLEKYGSLPPIGKSLQMTKQEPVETNPYEGKDYRMLTDTERHGILCEACDKWECAFEVNYRWLCGQCAFSTTVDKADTKPSTKVVTSRVCDHWRDEIPLLGGTVLASAYWSRPLPVTDAALEPYPDCGFYLDWSWPKLLGDVMGCGMDTFVTPLWPFVYVDWPDNSTVSDSYLKAMVEQIEGLLRQGKRIELACMGSHGRTGTVLSALACREGRSVADACAWVRKAHCTSAVETESQINQLYRLTGEERAVRSHLCGKCQHGRKKHNGGKCQAKKCTCFYWREDYEAMPSGMTITSTYGSYSDYAWMGGE